MAANNNNQQEVFETAASGAKIGSLLQTLLKTHSLLNIKIANNGDKFTSVLLGIDESTATLILDELHPLPHKDEFTAATAATISAQHAGNDIQFDTRVEAIPLPDGQIQYKAAYPESILHRQRRNAYRVPISAISPADVYVYLDSGRIFKGALRDISVSGMSVRFPPKTQLPETWPDEVSCEICLTQGKRLRVQFNVCHIAQHQPSRNFFLGGLFTHLEKPQERTIEKFVAELQRKSRQRMIR